MIKDKKILARMADEDLRTPSHDAIMVWLHENINHVCKKLLATELDLQSKEFSNGIKQLSSSDMVLVVEDMGVEKIEYSVNISSKWEAPIGSKNFIAGFIDLLAVVVASSIPNIYVSAGYDSKRCVNYWKPFNRTIAFEVKSSIRSIGETIRQINTYRSYMISNTMFCIVSPDDRFRDILESQGILFVKAPAVGDSSVQGGLF